MKIAFWMVSAFAVVLIAFVVLKEAGVPIDTTFSLDTSSILAPDCRKKATLDAELHISSGEDGNVWATDRQTGATISLRFDGSLGLSPSPVAIVDAESGRIVGRSGDRIVSGCFDLVQNAYQIGPSDLLPGS